MFTLEKVIKKRFFEKVNKTRGCWYWTGCKLKVGYGVFRINNKNYRSHRLSWEIHNNKKIPKNLCVLHTCDIRNCVNPKHLWLRTKADNNTDRHLKGRSNFNRKLNYSKVYNIRKSYKLNKIKLKEIAIKYNVTQATISLLLRNKTWK